MRVRVIQEPASEPVSLSDAKLHLRVDGSDDDALISALIVAARQSAEHQTSRALITQTLRLTLDAFPSGSDGVELLRPPVQSISAVQYVDASGNTVTLSTTQYGVDTVSQPAWLLPVYGTAWPATRDQANAVQIDYVAGYGTAAAVPQAIKQWMLLAIGDMYASREATVIGTIAERLSFFDQLLDPYRVWSA